MITSLTISDETVPKHALALPKGRLSVGELMADFSPECVVDAVRAIMIHQSNDELLEDDYTFVSQAGIIAFAAEKLGWNKNPQYKTI